MKKSVLLLAFLVALPVQAQSLLQGLRRSNQALPPSQTPTTSGSGSSTAAPPAPVSSNSTQCSPTEPQKSLPLAELKFLLLERDAQLSVAYDSRKGEITVSGPNMVANCNNMLNWKLQPHQESGQWVYSVYVEATPDVAAFEACLVTAGAIKENGEIQQDKVQPMPVFAKFPNINESGTVNFLDRGGKSPAYGPAYGTFDGNNGCDFYEKINPQGVSFKTAADAERDALRTQASTLAAITDCSQYGQVASFVDSHGNDFQNLVDVRNNLILEAARKAARDINEGKNIDASLRVMADFKKYIVDEKINQVKQAYEQLQNLEGPARAEAQTRLTALENDLKTYNSAPYFTDATQRKLESLGRFEDATAMNTLKITMGTYATLGTQRDNRTVTAEVAEQTINQRKTDYAALSTIAQEKYQVRTGQLTGRAEEYAAIVRRQTQNIAETQQNYAQEIQAESARKYTICPQQWWRVARCQQDSDLRIQQLQVELQAKLQRFNAIADQYRPLVAEYNTLENQGRAYVAQQNGEPTPADQPAPSVDAPATTPGTWNFSMTGQQGGQPQPGQPQPGMNEQQMLLQRMLMMQSQPQQPPGNFMFGQNGMFQQPINPFAPQQPMYGQQFNPMMAQGNMGLNLGFGLSGGMNQMGFNPMMSMGMGQMGMTGGPGTYGFTMPGAQGGFGPQQPMPFGYSGMNMYNMYGAPPIRTPGSL